MALGPLRTKDQFWLHHLENCLGGVWASVITIQNFILSIRSNEHLRESLTYDPAVEGLLGFSQISAWGWAAFLSSCALGTLYWLWKMILVAGSFWSHNDTLTSNVPVPEPPCAPKCRKWALELFRSPQATLDHLARRGSGDLPTRVTNLHSVLNSTSLKSMTSFIKQTVRNPTSPRPQRSDLITQSPFLSGDFHSLPTAEK